MPPPPPLKPTTIKFRGGLAAVPAPSSATPPIATVPVDSHVFDFWERLMLDVSSHDAILDTADGPLGAHQLVLCGASGALKAAVLASPTSPPSIDLTDVSKRSVAFLLRLLYCGSAQAEALPTEAELAASSHVAERLELTHLKPALERLGASVKIGVKRHGTDAAACGTVTAPEYQPACAAAPSRTPAAYVDTTTTTGDGGRYEVRTRVLARWQGYKKFYNGTIRAVHPDGTYSIAYDDGDVEVAVPAKFIQLPSEFVPRAARAQAQPSTSVLLEPDHHDLRIGQVVSK